MMAIDSTAQMAPIMWGMLVALLVSMIGIVSMVDRDLLKALRNGLAERYRRGVRALGVVDELVDAGGVDPAIVGSR